MNTNFLSKFFASFIIILSSILIFPQNTSAGVNPDGSFSYSVPIKVPEGTNGMQPNLSLAYNSNNKNGIVGYGWKLQGLPVITRNTQFPIEYEGEDNYIGPGGRLVEVATDIYHYVEEKFIKLQRVKVDIGNGKFETLQWIAHHPDGTKYYYGSTSDSRIKAEGQDFYRYRAWTLSKIDDVFGNSMKIEYFTGSDFNTYGAIYPKEITYTENTGISKIKKVEFEYDSTEGVATYSFRSKVKITKKLKTIKVFSGITTLAGVEVPGTGNIFRKYVLEYENRDLIGSRITNIHEYNHNDDLRTTSFTWEKNKPQEAYFETEPQSLPELLDYDSEIFYGDFNGDGSIDLFRYKKSTGANILLLTRMAYIGGGQLPGGGQIPVVEAQTWFRQYNVISTDWFLAKAPDSNIKVLSGDFNGDGREDLVKYGTTTGHLEKQLNTSGRNTIDNITFEKEKIYYYKEEQDALIYGPAHLLTVEYKRIPIFLVKKNYNGTDSILRWHAYSGEIDNSAYSEVNYGALHKVKDKDMSRIVFHFGDWNGDKITDFCVYDKTHSNIFWYIYDKKTKKFLEKDVVLPDIGTSIVTGDWNGDGITDLGFINVPDGSIPSYGFDNCFYVNDGNLNFIDYEEYALGIGTYGADNFAVCDFNGDGKSDVFVYSRDLGKNYLYISKNGLFTQSLRFEDPLGQFTNKKTNLFIGKTSNKRGLNSYNAYFKSSDKVFCKNIQFAGHEFISEIQTYDGKKLNIKYNEDVNISYGEELPTNYRHDLSPRYMVEEVKVTGSSSNIITSNYNFYNGKIYRDRLHESRYLYFEKVEEETQGKKKTTYFRQDDYRLAGKPSKVEIYARNSSSLVKKIEYSYHEDDIDTIYTYSDVLAGESNRKTRNVKTKSVETSTYENGILAYTNTASFEYNDYGAVTFTKNETSGTDPVEATTTYLDIHEENWYLNRPEKITVTSNGTFLRDKRFNWTGMKLDSVEQFLDVEAKWIGKSFSYDECGNIQTVTDALGNQIQITFDDDYKSTPNTIIGPNNDHTTEVTIDEIYDVNYSKIVSVKDPNGNITKYKYDHYERLIELVEPGDEWTRRIKYNDHLLGNELTQHVEVQVKDDSELGYHYSKDYFDNFGRVYRSVSKADNNLEIIKETAYDSYGRKIAESNPYINGVDSPSFTKFSYDSSDRITRVTAPHGNDSIFDQYEYAATNNRAVITRTNANNNSFISEYDARGNLLKKSDPLNSFVKYQYTPLGELEKVIQQDKIITNIVYDSLGQRKSITDPNTGTWKYTYDDIGRTKTTEDARGVIITNVYDKMSIVKEYSNDNSYEVNYFYDQEEYSNGKGALTSVVKKDGSNEIVTKYGYDAKGNVSALATSIDNAEYAFAFSYDSQNRLKSIQYPDSSEFTNQYADAGFLKSIKHGTGNVVQYGREVADGQSTDLVIKRISGNGFQTNLTFDAASLHLKTMMTKKILAGDLSVNVDIHEYQPNSRNAAEDGVVQDLSYEYDNIGNILKISDNVTSTKTQSFQYDALNRLKYAKGIYGEGLYQYDQVGNLRNKGFDSSIGGTVEVGVDIHEYKPNRSVAPGGVSLAYNNAEHPFAVSSDSNGNAYSYDNNGNMVNRKGTILTYNHNNKLASTSNGEEYTYDHSGHRIRHKTSDGKTIYNIGGFFEVIKKDGSDDSCSKYIYGISSDLVAKIPAVQGYTNAQSIIVGRHLYNKDTLKGMYNYLRGVTNLVISDSKYYRYSLTVFLVLVIGVLLFLWIQNIILGGSKPILFRWAAHLSPLLLIIFISTFGFYGCFQDTSMHFPEALNSTDTLYFHANHKGSISLITNGEGTIVSNLSYTPYGNLVASESTGTDVSDEKYTGQKLDSGTGLYYYGARFYDPDIGRFISPDSIIDGPGTTQGWNRYMYVHGNPVMHNDPSGNSSEAILGAVYNTSRNQPDIIYTGGGSYNDDNGSSYNGNSYIPHNEGGANSPSYYDLAGGGPPEAGPARIEAKYNISSDSLSHSSFEMSVTGGSNYSMQDYQQDLLKIQALNAAADWLMPKNLSELVTRLDVLGTTPVVGIFFDVASGIVSLMQGNYGAAGMSFGAALPGAGQAFGAAKIGLAGATIVGKVARVGKYADGLYDGIKISRKAIFSTVESFLGKGYKFLGNGRYISTDGLKQVRMGMNDLLGKHGGAPHMNFEILKPNPIRPDKMQIDKNLHIFFKD